MNHLEGKRLRKVVVLRVLDEFDLLWRYEVLAFKHPAHLDIGDPSIALALSSKATAAEYT